MAKTILTYYSHYTHYCTTLLANFAHCLIKKLAGESKSKVPLLNSTQECLNTSLEWHNGSHFHLYLFSSSRLFDSALVKLKSRRLTACTSCIFPNCLAKSCKCNEVWEIRCIRVFCEDWKVIMIITVTLL